MKIGDKVKVIGAPSNLSDVRDPPDEPSLKELFERCIGKTFTIESIENRDFGDNVSYIFVELEVGEVVGEEPFVHSIYLEEKFIEIVED